MSNASAGIPSPRQDFTTMRPSVYNEWDNLSMVKAMTAVENGTSIRRASELYMVPKSTLHDRVSGKVQHGTKPGRTSYLTALEEAELVNFLCKCAEIGYPHTISQVLAIVQRTVDSKGLNCVVTHGWWQRFCQRNSGISLRTAVPLSMTRAKASDIESLEKYYDILEDILKLNSIYNNPGRIYNIDETGLPLNPKGMKVVAKTGAKSVSGVCGGDKSQITVLACVCAAGSAIPPFVIFDRKTLNPDLTTGEVPGTMYGLSANGWMNQELFTYWFYHHFLMSVPPVRPLVVIMDGHSSHYNPDFIRAAAEEKIIVFVLPPNTTHLTLPLDKGCFGPLKSVWKKVTHEFYTHNPGRVVSRYDFSSLFGQAWKQAMTQNNVLSGFRTTGIYPFDPNKVLSRLQPQKSASKEQLQSLPQRTGLNYIPFYSPARGNSSKQSSHDESSFSEDEVTTPTLERSLSENDVRDCVGKSYRSTSISQFLHTPLPPSKIPTKYPKSSGKVLTSLENLQAMEEKERKKEEERNKKEERKAQRAANAKKKAAKKTTMSRKPSGAQDCESHA